MNTGQPAFSKRRLFLVTATIFGGLLYLYISHNSTSAAIKDTCGHFTKGSKLIEFWAAFKEAGADGFTIELDGKPAISIYERNLESTPKWNFFLEKASKTSDGVAIAYANVWPSMIAECRVTFVGQSILSSEFSVFD